MKHDGGLTFGHNTFSYSSAVEYSSFSTRKFQARVVDFQQLCNISSETNAVEFEQLCNIAPED